MLNSWARAALLFSSRLARLTQAMRSSSVTAPASTVSVGAMSLTIAVGERDELHLGACLLPYS